MSVAPTQATNSDSSLALLHDWRWDPPAAEIDAATLRIMAVHAHPDDEASKGAATIAKYVGAGARASLVTCTGGEAGDILNPKMDLPEVVADLPQVRMRELAESVRISGYATAYLLGFRDSGMPDTDANAHADAFGNADLDEAVARLVHIVRRERPHVLLAYDEHEFYPHPDHIMAHRIAMAAYEAAADPSFKAAGLGPDELGEPWQMQKLYWFHWSMRRIRLMHEEFLRRGMESPFAEWIDKRPDNDGGVTTRIDVADTMEVTRAALIAHRTQVDPDGFWMKLPTDVMRSLWPYEEYVLVRNEVGEVPTPSDADDASLETDLFAGLR